VKLLRTEPNSLILGRQVGNTDAGDYVQKINKGSIMYRHNAESFKKMWDEVGQATGTKWKVHCDFKLLEWLTKEERDEIGAGMGMIRFSAFRQLIATIERSELRVTGADGSGCRGEDSSAGDADRCVRRIERHESNKVVIYLNWSFSSRAYTIR
jgi:hypothetical protein